MAEVQQKQPFVPELGKGFIPFAETWEGGPSGPPLFPSEMSARWFLRNHRTALIDHEALAYHLGRLFVHEERLREARVRIAIDATKKKRP